MLYLYLRGLNPRVWDMYEVYTPMYSTASRLERKALDIIYTRGPHLFQHGGGLGHHVRPNGSPGGSRCGPAPLPRQVRPHLRGPRRLQSDEGRRYIPATRANPNLVANDCCGTRSGRNLAPSVTPLSGGRVEGGGSKSGEDAEEGLGTDYRLRVVQYVKGGIGFGKRSLGGGRGEVRSPTTARAWAPLSGDAPSPYAIGPRCREMLPPLA
eukprot:1178657-Prorocentrum_minimum.AAC.2